MKAKLYLIPTVLSDSNIDRVLPLYNNNIVKELKFFIVENIRTARRFLKQVDKQIDIDSLTFFELNQHTDLNIISTYIEPLLNGNDIGIISEAGCPAIADPGASVVEIAQSKGIQIIPLVGPSSILLSLMASGFNGQSFTFNGYLPIDKSERALKIKQLEKKVYNENQTQIFIETPYRNMQLIDELCSTLQSQTKLCVAVDITSEEESIKIYKINDWKKYKTQINIHKKPAIFLIYK